MVSPQQKSRQNLDTAIEKAVDFHGHLGPFLVVGVRMGIVGLQKLEARQSDASLQVTVSVKQSVPFSCVIDGIQVTTKCTIGNGRLRLRSSSKEISAALETSSKKEVTVTLNPARLAELRRSMPKTGASEKLEKIARNFASMPEEDLFIIQK